MIPHHSGKRKGLFWQNHAISNTHMAENERLVSFGMRSSFGQDATALPRATQQLGKPTYCQSASHREICPSAYVAKRFAKRQKLQMAGVSCQMQRFQPPATPQRVYPASDIGRRHVDVRSSSRLRSANMRCTQFDDMYDLSTSYSTDSDSDYSSEHEKLEYNSHSPCKKPHDSVHDLVGLQFVSDAEE
jgi:hypothetical protein